MRACLRQSRVECGGSADETLKVSVYRGVAAVDEHEWDALVGDRNFYNSHAWLAGLDHALGACDVLAVWGPAGLLAACPLWDGGRDDGLFELGAFFADVRGPWTRGFVWGGGRRSTHNEIAAIRGRRRPQVVRRLLQSMNEQARERGLAGVVMPYMPLAAAQELAQTAGASVLLHSAEANMDVPTDGLAGLMARWNAHDRGQCKSEIAAFARCGNRVECGRIDAANQAVAAELIARNRARHGSAQGGAWMQSLFDGQRRAGLLASSIAFVARREQRILAVCVCYRFGRALHVRYFGCDYDLDDRDFRYFVLTCYEPIDYAARQGLGELRLSTSALHAKAGRGARIEPLAAAVLLTDRALDPIAVHRHNRRFAERHRRELGAHLGPAWQAFL